MDKADRSRSGIIAKKCNGSVNNKYSHLSDNATGHNRSSWEDGGAGSPNK